MAAAGAEPLAPLVTLVITVLGMLISGAVAAAVSWKVKAHLENAKRGEDAESHAHLVTRSDCQDCETRHSAELSQGNELFRLLLEGQALQTQALIALCVEDKECRELRAKLQEHLAKLVSREIGR